MGTEWKVMRGTSVVMAVALAALLLVCSASCERGSRSANQLDDDDSEWNIRFHVSTKTPYWPQGQVGNYTEVPDSCEPAVLNLLARHGSRYPGSGDIGKYADLAAVMQANAQYYLPQFSWMASWTSPYQSVNADLLTYTGQVEHFNLADRLTEAAYPLLSEAYYPYVYPMQSTQRSRTGQSGSAFGYRMQENNGFLPPTQANGFMPFFIYTDSSNEDVLLRFFDNCPVYTEQVDDNPNATIQADIYETEVARAASYISEMIGVYPHWNISVSQVKLMYKQCGYDMSIYGQQDHFCTLFNEETGGILEYYNDLSNYWKKSYAYDINYYPACLLMKDFFNIFEGVITGSSPDTKAKLRFAHAETVLPFVTLLGLFDDGEPLMANWSTEQIANRKFRTSVISPFAGNVQAILYQCSSGSEEWLVRFLVNEKEVTIPGCSGVYCSFDQLQEILVDALNCDYEEICFPDAHPCDSYCSARGRGSQV